MRGAGGVRIRDLLSMTGVGGVISGLVRVRRARFARHRRRLQTALGLLALDSLRRRVDARLDEPTALEELAPAGCSSLAATSLAPDAPVDACGAIEPARRAGSATSGRRYGMGRSRLKGREGQGICTGSESSRTTPIPLPSDVGGSLWTARSEQKPTSLTNDAHRPPHGRLADAMNARSRRTFTVGGDRRGRGFRHHCCARIEDGA